MLHALLARHCVLALTYPTRLGILRRQAELMSRGSRGIATTLRSALPHCSCPAQEERKRQLEGEEGSDADGSDASDAELNLGGEAGEASEDLEDPTSEPETAGAAPASYKVCCGSQPGWR